MTFARGAAIPVNPTELLLFMQWQSSRTGVDAASAWAHASGSGVKVAVIDDGAEVTHHDLAPNIDPLLTRDFTNGSVSAPGKHGTAVASIIAGAADGDGNVGIAPNASLSILKVGFGTATDVSHITEAMVWAAEHHDVANASWSFSAPYSDNPAEGELSPLHAAYEAARAAGRGGLGTIFVFSAANDGASASSTAYLGLQNAVASLTIGSAGKSGKASAFSNGGGNLLAIAPGEALLVADLSGAEGYSYSDFAFFSGTSAAAPVGTGIVALILSAAAGLGDRDIQEIMAFSARAVPTDGQLVQGNSGKTWNGGGLGHSFKAGFGMLDAAAALRLAENWTAAAAWHGAATWSNAAQATGLATPGTHLALSDDGHPVTTTLHLGDQISIAKVALSVTLDPSIAVGTHLELISPSGTVASLTPDTPYAGTLPVPTGPVVWSFTSAAFWGESSIGEWTVRAADTSADGQSAPLTITSLTVYGTQVSANQRFVLTDAFLDALSADPSRAFIADHDGGRDVLDASPTRFQLIADLSAGHASLGGVAFSLSGPGALIDVFGGAGDDQIVGDAYDNNLRGGWGNDTLWGLGGNDTLASGSSADRLFASGTDWLDGGDGNDLAILPGALSDYRIGATPDAAYLLIESTTTGLHRTLLSVEEIVFDDGQRLSTNTMVHDGTARALYTTINAKGDANWFIPDLYDGPVPWLTQAFLGSSAGDVVAAGPGNDFLNLLGGDDAAAGGDGDDVLDGGTGSNFLSGGSGNNVFYLDARLSNGATGHSTWSTITDWSAGDQLSLWGWRPGVSHLSWEDDVGAVGWAGTTLRADIDGDGQVDASLTWTALTQADLPAPFEQDGLLWFVA